MSKIHCPVCGKELDTHYIGGTLEPFCAQDPMQGLNAYGPYPLAKTILHTLKTNDGKANYVHFKFDDDGEERLVIHAT